MSLEKKLFRDGPYADFFSQGVQVGNTLYLSGQVSTDDKGVAPADIVEQMKLSRPCRLASPLCQKTLFPG